MERAVTLTQQHGDAGGGGNIEETRIGDDEIQLTVGVEIGRSDRHRIRPYAVVNGGLKRPVALKMIRGGIDAEAFGHASPTGKSSG